ncbi:ABC transporter ATP-binding protein [Skermanella stibiiresistens SB22]|uniref:Spermidine/putrescine import ATP-binding protein PotA n=1 Tax=Skermanella stibiiresistens SB22 TaxID=1385369 RepID=W9GXD3_9PROT|nr:ABC transporter ATP-binding protein [Skermanella stibiiresistens]EWY38580.1 ABC transporter ATP-binding protein [Skermanella stibiiresistens SB22]
MASSIEIAGLRKNYGSLSVLDDISVSIKAGEFLTLLGPSGSGKTTLLMTIAGFVRPNAGSIKVDGREIVTLAPHKRNIGMVFQNYALFPHMSVGENVAYPLKLRGVGRGERDDRAKRALAAVRMEQYADRRIDQLSGGQRQRVAVARAIVFEPNIILMDEPLSALDKRLREEMQVELKRLHETLGRTIVYVTHDQKEALTMSDRVAVLKSGRIRQIASPRDIYDKPVDRFVADFIGDSGFVSLTDRGRGVDLAVSDGFRAAHVTGKADPLLLLRPEKIEIVSSPDAQPDLIRFDGVADDVLFQGDLVVVHATLADGTRLRLQRGTRQNTMRDLPAVGSRFRMAIHEEDAWVVSGVQAGEHAP